MDGLHQIRRFLQVDSLSQAQEVTNALLLCECVYKAHEAPDVAANALNKWKLQFGEACSLDALQCTLPHVRHRYVLATGGQTLYVACVGTKMGRDLIADMNILLRPVWQQDAFDAQQQQQQLLVHGGFLDRSRHVPAELLYIWARHRGQKLVFCGHSLGGAVAVLCTLRLLRAVEQLHASDYIKCISFGMPAIGNAALADFVSLHGWQRCFSTFVLPEDLVPRLISAAGSSSNLPSAGSMYRDSSSRKGAQDTSVTQPAPDSGDENAAMQTSAAMPYFISGWNLFQRAAVQGARSIQQLLPVQPRFIHFGSYHMLHPPDVSSQDKQAIPETLPPTHPNEIDRLGFLLPFHRMPAYRSRLLALVAAAMRGPHAGTPVRLSPDIAPRLSGIRAVALCPPLPLQQLPGFTTEIQPHHAGPQTWLPAGPPYRLTPGLIHMQISMRLPPAMHPASLHSLSHARLLGLPGAPVAGVWLQHPGPPPVPPLDAASSNTTSAATRMRHWLTRRLRSSSAARSDDQQPAVFEVALAPAQAAHALLTSSTRPSVGLRSDFEDAEVPLQLAHHQLWLLGGSAVASRQLLSALAFSGDTSGTSGGDFSSMGSSSNDGNGGSSGNHSWLSGKTWTRLWFGNSLPAPSATNTVVGHGMLACGMQFQDFCSSGCSMAEQFASLNLLLARATGSGFCSGSTFSTWCRQIWEAFRGLRLHNTAGNMLQSSRLPDMLLLLLHHARPEADVAAAASTCAAAAKAHIEVLVAASPALMMPLTSAVNAIVGSHSSHRVRVLPLPAGFGVPSSVMHLECSSSISAAILDAMARVHVRVTSVSAAAKL